MSSIREKTLRLPGPATVQVVPLLVFTAFVLALFFEIKTLNRGIFTYPLDDAYIHMSMARSAAEHGVWGITSLAFTSASSSPLWTFLLMLGYKAIGANELLPLGLSTLFGALTIWAAARLLNQFAHASMPHAMKIATLLVAIVCTPFYLMALLGMEHTLHAALTVLFLHRAVFELAPRREPAALPGAGLLLLAPLLTTSRYEGLFLSALVCLWLLVQRRILAALVLGGTALLPVAAYGLWAQSHDWYFLPVSVLLKSVRTSDTGSLLGMLAGLTIWKTLYERGSHLLVLISALLTCVYFRHKLPKLHVVLAWLTIGSLWLHLQFAQVGWLMRYEAYWIMLSIPVLAACASHLIAVGTHKMFGLLPKAVRVLCVAATITISLPMIWRVAESYNLSRRAANNMYEQQYQMAQFLKTYYAGKTVAINDIGMVAYFGESPIVDLWGLGTLEIGQRRVQNVYRTEDIDEITRNAGVQLAIIFDGWFPSEGLPAPPPSWKRAGTWQISNNVAAAFNTVTFYAVAPGTEETLVRNLRAFGPTLPASVKQAGAFVQGP